MDTISSESIKTSTANTKAQLTGINFCFSQKEAQPTFLFLFSSKNRETEKFFQRTLQCQHQFETVDCEIDFISAFILITITTCVNMLFY